MFGKEIRKNLPKRWDFIAFLQKNSLILCNLRDKTGKLFVVG